MSDRDDDDDENIDGNGHWIGGAFLIGAIVLIGLALLLT